MINFRHELIISSLTQMTSLNLVKSHKELWLNHRFSWI